MDGHSVSFSQPLPGLLGNVLTIGLWWSAGVWTSLITPTPGQDLREQSPLCSLRSWSHFDINSQLCYEQMPGAPLSLAGPDFQSQRGTVLSCSMLQLRAPLQQTCRLWCEGQRQGLSMSKSAGRLSCLQGFFSRFHKGPGMVAYSRSPSCSGG